MLLVLLAWTSSLAATAAAVVIDGSSGAAAPVVVSPWRFPQDVTGAAVGADVDVVLVNFRCRGQGAVLTLDLFNYSAAFLLPLPVAPGCDCGCHTTVTLRDTLFGSEAALVLVGALPPPSSSLPSLTVTIANVTLTDALLLLRDLDGDGGRSSRLSVVLANVTALWTQGVAAATAAPPPALVDTSWDPDKMTKVAAPVVVYNVTVWALLVLDSSFATRLVVPFDSYAAALYFPYPFLLSMGALFFVIRSTFAAVHGSGCSSVATTNVHAIRHTAPVVLLDHSAYVIAHSTLTATTTCGEAAAQVFSVSNGTKAATFITAAGMAAGAAVFVAAAAAVYLAGAGSSLLWVNCAVTAAADNTIGDAYAYCQWYTLATAPGGTITAVAANETTGASAIFSVVVAAVYLGGLGSGLPPPWPITLTSRTPTAKATARPTPGARLRLGFCRTALTRRRLATVMVQQRRRPLFWSSPPPSTSAAR